MGYSLLITNLNNQIYPKNTLEREKRSKYRKRDMVSNLLFL